MLLPYIVALLLFAAGSVFGQLLPGKWGDDLAGWLAIAADLATLCAAVAAIFALGAWRRQIRSQKAYDALAVVLSSFRDKDLTALAVIASSKGGADRNRADYNMHLIARDVRRCAEELEVLGYAACTPRLAKAVDDLNREVSPWFSPKESGTPLDPIFAIDLAVDRFVEVVYSLQKEVFHRGLW